MKAIKNANRSALAAKDTEEAQKPKKRGRKRKVTDDAMMRKTIMGLAKRGTTLDDIADIVGVSRAWLTREETFSLGDCFGWSPVEDLDDAVRSCDAIVAGFLDDLFKRGEAACRVGKFGRDQTREVFGVTRDVVDVFGVEERLVLVREVLVKPLAARSLDLEIGAWLPILGPRVHALHLGTALWAGAVLLR